jgi:hypothetical protein
MVNLAVGWEVEKLKLAIMCGTKAGIAVILAEILWCGKTGPSFPTLQNWPA